MFTELSPVFAEVPAATDDPRADLDALRKHITNLQIGIKTFLRDLNFPGAVRITESNFLASPGNTAEVAFGFAWDPLTGWASTSPYATKGFMTYFSNGSGTVTFGTASTQWLLPFLANDGSAGAPTYSFSADSDTGIYRIGNNNLGLAVGATKTWDYSTAITTTTLPVSSLSYFRGGDGADIFSRNNASVTAGSTIAITGSVGIFQLRDNSAGGLVVFAADSATATIQILSDPSAIGTLVDPGAGGNKYFASWVGNVFTIKNRFAATKALSLGVDGIAGTPS